MDTCLKPGWRMVKFGDVVKNANLVERDPEDAGIERIVGLEHLAPEDLHIRRWNDPGDGTSFTRKFVPGQTLFGKRRAYQRKIAYAEFEGICSGDILTFEPKDMKVLLPELLPFICQTEAFFDNALGTSAGSLSPRTSWKALKDFEFPLPPIEEQKRIAEILWAAANDVHEKRLLMDKSIDVHDAIISEVGFRLNPKSDLARWPVMCLQSIFNHKRDKGFSDLPILSVTIDGRLVSRDSLNRKIEDRTGPEKCFRVDRGDIAYNTMRMWQGACAMASTTGVISPAYTVISCKSQNQVPDFWVRVFRSKWMMKTFERYSTGVASDRWRLYFKDFGAIKVKVPPLDFQEKLLEELLHFDASIVAVENAITGSKDLLKKLTSPLLSGEINV